MDVKELPIHPVILLCPELARVRINPQGPVEVPKFSDQWAKRVAEWNKNPRLPNGEKC